MLHLSQMTDDQFDEESNQDERLSLTEETTFEQADENGQIKDGEIQSLLKV